MRYAITSNQSDDISDINKSIFDSSKFDTTLEVLIKKNNIDSLIISIAGPKINNSIAMTNRNYRFDAKNIKNKFKLKECFLLNDWEAIAYSYEYIVDSIDTIKTGDPFNNNKLFLGPGTGLGAAVLIDDSKVISTEVGNTNYSTDRLKKNFNIKTDEVMTLEKLLSGSGISYMYGLKSDKNISAEEVFKKYLDNDQKAKEVIDGFIKSLAEILSDLSLTFMSGGGIYLAGSLMRSLHKHIDTNKFAEYFLSNKQGVHEKLLRSISISLISKKRTPLYGNLAFYKKQLNSKNIL